jgi:hypothetical protein
MNTSLNLYGRRHHSFKIKKQMKNTLLRSFKTWFFTNLIGSIFFLLVFPETGFMDFDTFLIVFLFGGLFSSPSLLISTLAIRKLKTLREETATRLGFMAGITAAIIIVVMLLFEAWFGDMAFHLAGDLGLIKLLYPYCITGLAMSIYFTRDLVFVHHEETHIPHQQNTEL